MLLERFSDLGVRLEAITGFLAVFVLILVLNWFMHNVYWTGWLANQHARKRQILSGSGTGVMIGLAMLGFTSVFREGFETVFARASGERFPALVILQGKSQVSDLGNLRPLRRWIRKVKTGCPVAGPEVKARHTPHIRGAYLFQTIPMEKEKPPIPLGCPITQSDPNSIAVCHL